MLDTTADVTEILTPEPVREPATRAQPLPSTEELFRAKWRVGMHVLYRRPEGPHAGEERPAVIVRVNPSTCNLLVSLDGPNDSTTFDPLKAPTTEWRGSISPNVSAEGFELSGRDAWNTFREDIAK